jgi:hypothetical protein
LVERQFCKLDVAGSIPATGTTSIPYDVVNAAFAHTLVNTFPHITPHHVVVTGEPQRSIAVSIIRTLPALRPGSSRWCN